MEKHCTEILDRWQQKLSNFVRDTKEGTSENLDEKLSRLLEANVKLEETTHASRYTDEQLKIREAILSQYGHVSFYPIEFINFTLFKRVTLLVCLLTTRPMKQMMKMM